MSEPSIEKIRLLQRQGRHAAVLEPLRKKLESDPEDAELNYRYGVALLETNHVTSALWSLRKAEKDPEWMVEATLGIAAVAGRKGDFKGVIEATSRIIELEPEHLEAIYARGEAYLSLGKEPELALEAPLY